MRSTRNVIVALATGALCLVGVLIGAPAGIAASAPTAWPLGLPEPIHNVMDPPYNAAGDGTTSDRAAIQQALNDTAEQGGGTVLLPVGHTFLSGSLTLGSNTTLLIDGTLLQSQDSSDYTYTPIRGHAMPDASCPTCPSGWDLTMFHDLPFVYAGGQHDVQVVGSGTIQMTQAPSDASTIQLTPVGFYRVSHYAIAGLNVLGAFNYSISPYSTDHGLIKGLTIIPVRGLTGAFPFNTDGISLQNSQHVRITRNTIHNGDDAIYIWSSYRDPRSYQSPLGGKLWWSSNDPQPSTDIEIDHNHVTTCCMGAGFIPWGTGAPDPRTVETSHVSIHDNTLASSTRAVGCWCDNPFHGQLPFTNTEHDQSPITEVRIYNNTYNSPTFESFTATDLKTDYGALGSATVMNGNFEQLGTAWWSTKGDVGPDVGSTDVAHANVLRNPQARAALSQTDGWVGYIQPRGANTAKLYQGLGLHASIPGVPFDTGTFQLSADMVTGSDPVRLYVYDTCTEQTIADRIVTAPQLQQESLTFHLASDCDDVQVGIDRGTGQAGDVWGLIDNVAVANTTTAIDNTDPSVTYTGDWQTFSSNGDWGGTNATALTAGSTVSIPFNGSRAVVLAIIDNNLGIADIYLDGTLIKSVDYYAPTKHEASVVYDTSDIAPGNHTIRIVATGQKNAASVSSFIDFDALLVRQ